jgi:hypothetical protein
MSKVSSTKFPFTQPVHVSTSACAAATSVWNSLTRTTATLIMVCVGSWSQLLAKESINNFMHLHTSELASAMRLKLKLFVLQQQQASACQIRPTRAEHA